MQTYNTVNDIQTEVEALYKNVTGRENLTAVETDIVQGSIIDAYQFALLEYGVDTFKFQETSVTGDTTSGTNYIDLDEYVYKVVNGTVRIPAEQAVLGLIDEVAIFQKDPELTETGRPTHYAYMSSGDPNIIRLRLWPEPDDTYTIYLNVLKYPTDTITNFPTFLQSAIKNKAKALSCIGLGLKGLDDGFNRAYEDIIAKVKDGYHNNNARHVHRAFIPTHSRSVEGRIP
jgi:hypothetical protein